MKCPMCKLEVKKSYITKEQIVCNNCGYKRVLVRPKMVKPNDRPTESKSTNKTDFV